MLLSGIEETETAEAAHDMSFADKGAVADIEPAFFVGYLHRIKATGTLKFDDPPFQRAIYFRDGRILFSSSNAPEDQLGAILVSAGKIGQDQFDAVVASLEPRQSIAAALAQGGHVSQRDIGDAARHKVEQIVGTCCAQTGGQYEFEEGMLPKGALDLKLTTERVLVAAFEALEPSGFLNRILASPMAVLAPAEVEPADPELAGLREAVDGVSTLADIGGKVGLPLAATEARAAVLVALGAASVVTSQIEDMALPETGEDVTETLPPPVATNSEASESLAETITSELGSAPAVEATLAISLGSGLDASAEAADEMGQDLRLPSLAVPPAVPERQKPTAQELASIREKLRPLAHRHGSDPAPADQWEPRLSTASRLSPGRGGLAGVFESPRVRAVAGVLGLALVAGIAWIGYGTTQSRPAVVAPTPAAASTGPAPAASVSATLDASMPVASPSPLATLSPPVTTAGIEPSASPAAIAPPSPKATVPVAPLPTPAAPSPARATPSARPVQASPYEALKAGRLAEAAASSESLARGHSAEFSVQLLVACSPQTIDKALQNDPSPDLFVLPTTISGRPCHRLMRGFFGTSGQAAQAIPLLPAYYVNEGARPKAVPLKTVLR